MLAERIDAASKGLRSPKHEDRRSPRYEDRRSHSVDRRSRSADHRRHSPEHRSAINILVLEEHVARLIGRNGDNVKKLKSKTGAHITFQKEATTEVKPESSTKFKVCTVEGTPSQIEDAVRAILDNIKRLQDY
jgi:predicted PilT family ATPase